ITEIDPDFADAYFYLGVVYDKLKNSSEVKKYMQKAVEIEPDNAAALNYLGYTYADNGERLDEAIALINRALVKQPENGAYIDSLGWAYYKKGDFAMALQLLDKAAKLYGDDAVIYDHLGDAYMAVNDADNAVKAWKKSLQIDSSQGGIKEKISAASAHLPDGQGPAHGKKKHK
ncbi:MAG: tetratricopeptide repeat protein, partial [Candidatus Omnitrophica bacterium]|nr:tetratricopeptide repeat protein [Candidatus Omnitrophota bacterium]